ncbi:MAG: hypothetical protein VXV86_02795, partial [Verrucomicrobiota bacterium]|nr:hypothetical protein [Verrucomicrobiota bacterium]
MEARALKTAFDHLPENVTVYDFRDDSVHQIVEDEDAFDDAKEGKSKLCKARNTLIPLRKVTTRARTTAAI